EQQGENFGKLYRSCGNCSKQYQRNVVISNVVEITPPGKGGERTAPRPGAAGAEGVSRCAWRGRRNGPGWRRPGRPCGCAPPRG
ncbi:pectate lyase, partial [Streptosporangium sandarakinum]